jgi:hypothetical protein
MFKTISVSEAANEAIFIEQLTTSRAIKFVTTRARVDREKAVKAIDKTIVGYKARVTA